MPFFKVSGQTTPRTVVPKEERVESDSSGFPIPIVIAICIGILVLIAFAITLLGWLKGDTV